MENCGDFTKWLGVDMSFMIFMHLEDPSDLARVCSVSRSCRQFVIANGLFKKLCLRMVPEMAGLIQDIEVKNMIEPVNVGPSDFVQLECHERNHKVYSVLARGLTPFLEEKCIAEAICASSTDNYPFESIQNTLNPSDRVEHRASYWSSKGQSDPSVPETLLYRLKSNLCLITEIHVQPFQAYFQYGFPIYAAKAVRFRLGHPNFPLQLENDAVVDSDTGPKLTDANFTWTYTSPEFPMAQENCLQKFKLPEPVFCIGGILQVELLGRFQRQDMDGLFYICVSCVQAVGRPLSQPFDAEVDPTGKCILKYNPKSEPSDVSSTSETGSSGGYSLRALTMRLVERGVRSWENVLLSSLLGSLPIEDDE